MAQKKTPAERAAWGLKMKQLREAKKSGIVSPPPVERGGIPVGGELVSAPVDFSAPVPVTPVEVQPELMNYFCRREIKINGKKYMGLVTVPPKLAQTLACIDDKADAEKARATQNETHPLQPIRRGGAEVVL